MPRRFRSLIVLLAMFAGMSACGVVPGPGESAEPLFGKWSSGDGAEFITFEESGRFVSRLRYGANQQLRDISGTFTAEGSTVQFLPEADYPMTWMVTPSEHALEFRYEHGGNIRVDGAEDTFVAAGEGQTEHKAE